VSFAVPSKDYGAQNRALAGELLPAIERALFEEDPILGAEVGRFEEEFAAFLGVPHAVGVGSGTDALVLALRGLGVGAGDEVVVPAHTFAATITAVLMAGARPVLVDVEEGSALLAPEAAAERTGPSTRALLPVHLYGRPFDGPAFQALARSRGIFLVEDAAQAHGAEFAGRRAGAFGDAGCFSFHPSKNLGAFGDAGLVATPRKDLAARVAVLRNLGKSSRSEFAEVSGNAKLDTIQAAILRVKLRHLEEGVERRRAIAARYRERLAEVGDLRLPAEEAPGARVAWHLFVVRTSRRDALQAHLASRGIRAGVHYPVPPHRQPALRGLGHRAGEFPVAERLAREVLSLPISPELSNGQVGLVGEEVAAFFGGRGG
jgi:dTDP-4-amino-4,6-dideoxygalactose transaminase